eukprot:9380525-Alexandrium_andersonii.AAC.1
MASRPGPGLGVVVVGLVVLLLEGVGLQHCLEVARREGLAQLVRVAALRRRHELPGRGPPLHGRVPALV